MLNSFSAPSISRNQFETVVMKLVYVNDFAENPRGATKP